MRFFNIIANYGKQISTKSFEATECVERVSYVLFLSGITLQRYLSARCVFYFTKSTKTSKPSTETQ